MNPKEKAELAEQLAWLHEQNRIHRASAKVTLPPRRKPKYNPNSKKRGQYLTKKMRAEMSDEEIKEHHKARRKRNREIYDIKRECRLIRSFTTSSGTRIYELKIERKNIKVTRRMRSLEDAIRLRDNIEAQYKALTK